MSHLPERIDADRAALLMRRYERVLKDLDRLTRVARVGMRAAGNLDAKLSACKVQRVIEESRRNLRVQYYEFQDAARWADTTRED